MAVWGTVKKNIFGTGGDIRLYYISVHPHHWSCEAVRLFQSLAWWYTDTNCRCLLGVLFWILTSRQMSWITYHHLSVISKMAGIIGF